MRFGFCMGAMDCVYLEFTLFVTGRALGVCLETRFVIAILPMYRIKSNVLAKEQI